MLRSTLPPFLRTNPVLAIGLGILMLALSFLVGGATRDLILRVAGVLAILAGAIIFIAQRRR